MRYISIDFETTGLDTIKDEPMQIGIISCAEDFSDVRFFSSYIRPQKDRSELKQIVGLLTGLSLDDVCTAPNPDVVFRQVISFLGQEEMILIGHSVSFDYAFLQRFCPQISFMTILDTFDLAQTFVHYAGSYALEALAQTLEEKEEFSRGMHSLQCSVYGERCAHIFHDALYDSLLALALFRYCLARKKEIDCVYGAHLALFREKLSLEDRVGLWVIKPVRKEVPSKITNRLLPPLQLPCPQNKKLTAVKNTIVEPFCSTGEKESKWYFGETHLSHVVQEIIRRIQAGEKICIAVSHPYKIDILKRSFASFGYNDIGFLRGDQCINQSRLARFLQKKTFTSSELFFLYKYCSQHRAGYSVIDATSQEDKKIMYFLQDMHTETEKKCILTTHGGLYTLLHDPVRVSAYSSYTMLFWDTDWRYTTYNMYQNQPFDMYFFLEVIEKVAYTYTILAEEEEKYIPARDMIALLVGAFQVWIGVFFIDATEMCRQAKQDVSVLSSLIEMPGFRQTRMGWRYIQKLWDTTKLLLEELHMQQLALLFTKLEELLYGAVRLATKIYNQAGLSYTLAYEVSYTDFSEFLALLRASSFCLCSSFKKERERIPLSFTTTEQSSRKPPIPLYHITSPEGILQFLTTMEKDWGNIVVVSGIKGTSQKLVSALYAKNMHKERLVIAENITGGVKKNIIKAQSTQKKVVIGGYHFLLGLFANGWRPDACIAMAIFGSLQDVICKDIVRRGE